MSKRKIPPEIRQACLKRDNETCQSEGCELSQKNGDKLNLHHILPEQFGGKETADNLITLCDIHHKNMHAEFHAFYPDSKGILLKMNRLTKQVLSKIRHTLGIDDGYDLTPYLMFLTGKKSFRPGQLKTIRAALSGKDVLFVTPTGSGKSVCYQLPGLLGNDPSLIVSPLKALMKDQVESIWSKKIPTTYINSDISQDEKNKRYEYISQRLYKFIFVAPERFDSKDPKTSSLYSKYSHLVIDEAHEIEMWGMAFRPSYRKLGELRQRLNNPPLIALTATASKETQDHILESLNVQNAEVIVTGFYRKNIHIKIHRSGELDKENKFTLGKYDYIKKVILENPGQKILIFAATVKHGEELLRNLVKNNIEADFYHSKLDSKEKMQIQNRFSGTAKPKLYVLISTSAFGMGIDIASIRHVIHLSMPLSVTDYTQQIGRAGRDGLRSYAHLLYHENDNGLLSFMSDLPLKQAGFAEKHGYSAGDISRVKQKLQKQVEDMLEILNQPEGKEWQYILGYFGETPPSFWDKRGKIIIDLFLLSAIIFIFVGFFWLFILR